MDDNLARLRIERGVKPDVSRGATRRRLGRYALGAITAVLVAYLAARTLLDPRLSVAVGTAVVAVAGSATRLRSSWRSKNGKVSQGCPSK